MGIIEDTVKEYALARRLLVTRWLQGLPAGVTQACLGCAETYCCYQMALAHPMEGVVVAAALREAGRGDEVALAEKQGKEQHRMWMKDYDRISRCETLEEAEAKCNTAADAWYDKKEPCAFMRDGSPRASCSIYPVRPIMCSTYYTRYRCDHFPGSEEGTEAANNMEIVAAVMGLSDLAFGVLTGNPGTTAAPIPFPYAVALGDCMLAGKGVGVRVHRVAN